MVNLLNRSGSLEASSKYTSLGIKFGGLR